MGAEPPTKEDIKEVMEVLDTDRSNSIEKEEFGELIKKFILKLKYNFIREKIIVHSKK